MGIDFEKAFLNGHMSRDVCIRLPVEDARSEGGESGRLLRVLGRCDRGVTGLAPPEAPPTARPDGL